MKQPKQDRPLPQLNAESRPFWDYCRAHELRFQKCGACGHVRWPASMICPMCYERDAQWVRSNGKGTVYTFVVYRHAFHPAFAAELPYVAAIIALADGPHFMSNIVGCRPEDVRCDMAVELCWREVGNGFSLPVFKLVGSKAAG